MELKGTIMEKMGIGARMNWDQETEEQAKATLEALEKPEDISSNITYGSEIASIDGLVGLLNLTQEESEQLKSEIYTNSEISSELAEKIRNGMKSMGTENAIIDTLSVVHDEWVKNNGNNFEARPRNFQFVDLRLLSFEEAKKDLLFLQPIVEACGVEVDMDKVEKEFDDRQQKYMDEKGIDSHESLVEQLKKGAEFYPALEGITTNKKNKEGPTYLITDLLADPEIAEKTAVQIEGEIEIGRKHSKEEAKAFAQEPALEGKLLKEAKAMEQSKEADKDVSDDE